MNYIFCTNCGLRLSYPNAPCQLCPKISDFHFTGTTQIFAPEIETLVIPKQTVESAAEKPEVVRFFQLFFITAASILAVAFYINR